MPLDDLAIKVIEELARAEDGMNNWAGPDGCDYGGYLRNAVLPRIRAARGVPAYRVELRPPPSTNNLFSNVPGKGRVRTPRYKSWHSEAAMTMVAAGPRPHIEGRVHLVIEGHIRGDVDNLKAIPDLLVGMGILGDDRQVWHFESIRREGGELVTVSVWRMG